MKLCAWSAGSMTAEPTTDVTMLAESAACGATLACGLRYFQNVPQ